MSPGSLGRHNVVARSCIQPAPERGRSETLAAVIASRHPRIAGKPLERWPQRAFMVTAFRAIIEPAVMGSPTTIVRCPSNVAAHQT